MGSVSLDRIDLDCGTKFLWEEEAGQGHEFMETVNAALKHTEEIQCQPKANEPGGMLWLVLTRSACGIRQLIDFTARCLP